MPTYEYACRECDHGLEVVQSFTDDPLRVCPQCGGDLRKVYSAAGIIFKGSGYYVTDSRAAAGGTKNGDTGSKKDAQKTDATSESSGSGSSDSSGSSKGSDSSGTSDSSKSSSSNKK